MRKNPDKVAAMIEKLPDDYHPSLQSETRY